MPLATDEVHRLVFDVDFPPGHAAAYLVPGEAPVLVDAGTLGSAGEDDLREGLAAHGYAPADVAHVLVTHRHVDHLGQVGTLREVADPTIHAPTTFRAPLDRSLDALERTARSVLRDAGVVDEETVDRFVSEFVSSREIMREVLPASAVDDWIRPGESTTVGPMTVDPIHTPGHHETHVCYAADLADERVLFSGDVALEPFRALTIHAGLDDGIADGVDAYYEALDRLDALAVDRVFPGHGPVHADLGGTVAQAIDGLDRRLDGCEATLREGPATALDVTATIADGEQAIGRTLPEVVAALATLERRGRARSSVDDAVRVYEAA